MTSAMKVTAIVILATVIVLLGYDVYAFIHGGLTATISWVLWQYSHDYPAIPLFAGILIGHLFLGMDKVDL